MADALSVETKRLQGKMVSIPSNVVTAQHTLWENTRRDVERGGDWEGTRNGGRQTWDHGLNL